MKKLFVLILIVAIGTTLWFVFGLWVGLYSVYSYPPSKDHPSGATLLIAREEGEPTFNSPQFIPIPKKIEKKSGISFGTTERPHKPVADRTILELPYVEWAHKKSLEPPDKE